VEQQSLGAWQGYAQPTIRVFAQRIGGNILDITWAWSIYLGMTGILTIVAGRLVGGSTVGPTTI
jgi:hypothetical protein